MYDLSIQEVKFEIAHEHAQTEVSLFALDCCFLLFIVVLFFVIGAIEETKEKASSELNESIKKVKQPSNKKERKHYSLPMPDYTVEPIKHLTKAQFDQEVVKLSKKKEDIVEEQRKRK